MPLFKGKRFFFLFKKWLARKKSTLTEEKNALSLSRFRSRHVRAPLSFL